MVLALAAALGTGPSTGSLAERPKPVHAFPNFFPASAAGSILCSSPLVASAHPQSTAARRQPPLAAIGVTSQAEMVSLRGHEVPLHLRGVLSGFAGGLAGSSVSFLLHPLDTLKTIKQAKSGINFKG